MIIWLAIGWHAGILLARLLPQPPSVWLIVAALALLSVWPARHHTRARLALAILLAAALGAARYQATQPEIDPTHLAWYNDLPRRVTLTGIVIGEPDVRDQHVNLQVLAQRLRIIDDQGDFATIDLQAGIVLIQAPRVPAIAFGEMIEAGGELQTPPSFEDFDYADYLARQGVHSVLRTSNTAVFGPAQCPTDLPQYSRRACLLFDGQRALFDFKTQALVMIARLFPEPQAALLSGILLGVESSIPAWLQADFRTTGTSHIVAISGFNITIIAGVVVRVLHTFIAKRRAEVLAVAVVVVYTVLAGADGSVVRSAIMAAVLLLSGGLARGGRSNGLFALATAALVMTYLNPLWLWDLGFQLSVAATLGLILYADRFTDVVTRLLARLVEQTWAEQFVRATNEFTTVTLAAQLAVLPLLAFYFHQVSLVSLLANVVVLPLQPAVMILGGLATLLGLVVWQPLGQLLAWVTWPFVTLTIEAVRLLAQVPYAVLPLPSFSWGWLLFAYGLLFGATWILARPPDMRPAWWQRLARKPGLNASLVLLAIGTLLAWQPLLALPDGRLHVRYLDVGDGQATLIRTPAGRYVLIDGGPSPNRLADNLGQLLPLNQRELDLVVATSADSGHMGGLPGLFERQQLHQVLLLAQPTRSRDYREWTEGLAQREIVTITPEPDTPISYDLGDGVRLTVLSNVEDRMLLELTWGRARFLFAPDLTAEDAAALAATAQVPSATVLLLPRQAAAETLDADFVAQVNPWAAVVSVAASNPDGAPAAATLRLFDPARLLRTDRHGWIEFTTDGQQLWATTER